MDTLLTAPNNVRMRLKGGVPKESLTDEVFYNFVYYARNHWHYAAGRISAVGDARKLLDGTGKEAACQGFTAALRLVFTDGLGIGPEKMAAVGIKYYFWASPKYKCFDPLVKGNIRKLHGLKTYHQGTIFSEHWYFQCCGKYYDPTMACIYRVKDELVVETFPAAWDPGTPDNQASGTYINLTDSRKLLITTDQQTCILMKKGEARHGFTSAWVLFEPTKENFQQAFGKFLKEDMESGTGNGLLTQFILHCLNASDDFQPTVPLILFH
jgi:hypothetical protein